MQFFEKIFDGDKKLLYAWFSAMFTRVDVMLCAGAGHENLVEIAKQIHDEMIRIEAFANRFNTASELSLINIKAFEKEMPVSEELFSIIAECLDYNKKTLGYFDVTANSFNYFRAGAQSVILNTEMHSIRFTHSDVQLDLSGYIKGWSLRAVLEILRKGTIENALVNAGNSSVLAVGNHPFGNGWKVANPGTGAECVLLNECLTTSGNREDTKWPVINPLTGEAEVRKPVSVITADPAIGEVLSTALYLAGEAERGQILKQFEVRII